MKTNLLLLSFSILIFCGCGSIRIEKRKHLKGWSITSNRNYNSEALKVQTNLESIDNSLHAETSFALINKDIISIPTNSSENLVESVINIEADNRVKNAISPSSQESSNKLVHTKNNLAMEDSCDLIVCKNGDEIYGRVIEIGLTEIKYKKCDNPTGPTISIANSSVLMIKYPNGTKDIISSTTNTTNINSGPKVNPLALASMICGILALFTYFGAIPLAIAPIVLSVLALKQIKANPDNYSPASVKMAKAGIICGIIGLSVWVILIIFLL